MNNGKKRRSAGIGVGYVTVMIVFAIICLTIFAVLSFRAAGSNDALNERSGEYLRQYYAADMKAKEILSQLCESAESARSSGFFFEEFSSAASALDKVTIKEQPDGISAEFSVDINERQTLCASVTFYELKNDYTINFWKNKTSAFEPDNSGLNVWDGTN